MQSDCNNLLIGAILRLIDIFNKSLEGGCNSLMIGAIPLND